jgi:hypothetical protein
MAAAPVGRLPLAVVPADDDIAAVAIAKVPFFSVAVTIIFFMFHVGF